jgi:hypothetical protein
MLCSGCLTCGIDRRLPAVGMCPILDETDHPFKLRCYRKVNRPTAVGKKQRTQEEIVEVEVTAREAYTHLRNTAKLSLPHSWDASWDAHHRRLHYETFTRKTLTIMTDFSATFDIIPQHQITCAIPAHAILAVFVVSVADEMMAPDGSMKRIVRNHVHYFWATTTNKNNSNDKLKNNNFMHIQCLKWLLNHYKKTVDFDELVLFTDGCAGQYKCRKNCLALTELVKDIPFLQRIIHAYAPTACFKTIVDGSGEYFYTHNANIH